MRGPGNKARFFPFPGYWPLGGHGTDRGSLGVGFMKDWNSKLCHEAAYE